MGARTSLRPMAGINRHYEAKYRCWGWYVRLGHKGRVYRKYFADKKYGGRENARALAKDWRFRTLLRLGIHTTSRAASCPLRGSGP